MTERVKAEKNKYDWRWENSINATKKRVTDEEHKYVAWRTNSSLSNYPDTIMHANEMNIRPNLSWQAQYDYLFYAVRKRKRFFKKDAVTEDPNFDLVRQHYKYSVAKTREALRVLTPEQIEIIKRKTEEGGF